MGFFPRYSVTISICPPNNADCREQLTYLCNPEHLIQDPDLLKAYILEVHKKLEERLEREGAVTTERPVRETLQTGEFDWPKGTELE